MVLGNIAFKAYAINILNMIVLYVFICVIIIGLAYCFSEVLRFKVTSYTITSPKLSHDLNNFRILQLSDLHCISFGRNNSKLLSKIIELKPDIIIISGDLINGLPARKMTKNFKYAEDFLKQLKSTGFPVYYEFGNHELKLKSISDEAYNSYIDSVSSLCTLLNNESCELSSNCVLSGLVLDRKLYKGHISAHRKKLKIRPYIGKCDRSSFNILIAHDPSFAEKYFRWGADLVLSGHLHGGIIRLPFIGGIISPRYELFPRIDKGQYKFGNNSLIVSGGLGWHHIPFRFNNIPEMVLIELHAE